MDRSTDVIVIGAGISGCAATKLLHEAGVEVLLLEARGRVGGRTHTKRDPAYGYVDLGGSYVGPTQDRIFRLATELGVETYKVNDAGDYIHHSRGHGIRFHGTWPKFSNPLAWLDVNNLFRVMDNMLAEIPPEAPWDALHAELWDSMTVKQWLDEVVWTREAMEFGMCFVSENIAMEPSELSLLWFLWNTRSCGGTQRISKIENGGLERKFYGGANQISEKIVERLGDLCIKNSPVCGIIDKQDVVVQTLDGKKYKAKYGVLCFSPTLYSKITFEPPLPPLKQQLSQRVPMGSCIKTQMWYKTPFWRAKGINGYSSSGDGISPVSNTVDDTKPDGSHPAITGFIVSDQARKLCGMTRDERFKLQKEYYAKLFQSKEALNPIGYEEGHWMAEQWTAGCYAGTYPPGVMTRYGREIRKSVGHIYFGGTETAVLWSGYMDGAVEAGERAAREVLHAMGKITSDQIWQKEPEHPLLPVRPFQVSWLERNAPSVGGFLKFVTGLVTITTTSALIYKYHHTISDLIIMHKYYDKIYETIESIKKGSS